MKEIPSLAGKDLTHAIDVLNRLMPGRRKTNRSVDRKTRDVVVGGAVDHAIWNDQPVTTDGIRGKRDTSRLGVAAVLPVLPICVARQHAAVHAVVELLGLSGKIWVWRLIARSGLLVRSRSRF